MSYIFSSFAYNSKFVDLSTPSSWCLSTIQENIKSATHSKNSQELLTLMASAEMFKNIIEQKNINSDVKVKEMNLLLELNSVAQLRLRKISQKETVEKSNLLQSVSDPDQLTHDIKTTEAILAQFEKEFAPMDEKIKQKIQIHREIQSYFTILEILYSEAINSLGLDQAHWEEIESKLDSEFENFQIKLEALKNTNSSRRFKQNDQKVQEIISGFDLDVAREEPIISRKRKRVKISVIFDRIKREKTANKIALMHLASELYTLKHARKKLHQNIVLLLQLEKLQNQNLKELSLAKNCKKCEIVDEIKGKESTKLQEMPQSFKIQGITSNMRITFKKIEMI